MDVITLRLEPALGKKLEVEAEEKGFSNRTEYIRFILRNRSEHAYGETEGSSQNISERNRTPEELVGRIDELEERIDALESDSGNTTDSRTSADGDPTPEHDEVRISTGVGARTRAESETAEDDGLAESVRSYIEENNLPPKSDHERSAVIDVFRLLREHRTMETSELQEALYSDFEEHWDGPRAMWNAIGQYLEDVPGIQKGGDGDWTYTGDDDVRSLLEDSD